MTKFSRTIMDLAGAPWVDRRSNAGPMQASKKLTAPDGRSVGLLHMDGPGRPHLHTRTSTLFILDGTITLRDRSFGKYNWVLEPAGAIHPQTVSDHAIYGLGMSDGDFGIGNVFLDSPDSLPDWTSQLGLEINRRADAVDSNRLPYQPFGPGLGMKVLHVFEGRPAFAALVHADAGTTLPSRRYLGPADMYVLSGRMEFADKTSAGPGWWIHEPSGFVDDVVHFPVETEFLANTYGTIVELNADGTIQRLLEGNTIQETLATAEPQHA